MVNNEPLYVVKINTKNNSITVGTKKNLVIDKIDLRDVNILGDRQEFNNPIKVKVRSTGKLIKAKVTIQNSMAQVSLMDEETGISPGQACVFYNSDTFGDKLLGGGWIDKTYNKNLST